MLNVHKPQSFNLSDLKADKTQYFESPKQSPFEPSEISARSTTLIHKNVPTGARSSESNPFFDNEFDAIMRSSTAAVKSMYRESMGRLSVFPRTADMSLRTSISSYNPKISGGDFWDEAMVSTNSFAGKNYSMASDDFKPAEQMAEKMQEDEISQEQEYATVPQIQKSNSTETNWEERSMMRQPEMSFGQYCNDFLGTNNIREVYGNKSPAKRNRVALVELDTIDSPRDSNRLELSHLQRLISK